MFTHLAERAASDHELLHFPPSPLPLQLNGIDGIRQLMYVFRISTEQGREVSRLGSPASVYSAIIYSEPQELASSA